ncbi:MAG: hypothetical protein H6971_08410 [Gammaproteobacteria bacterium]|nr:hypothetical protein [Gammaproteobacteria bacterium]
MKITRYELMPQTELLDRLKQTRLKGFDRPFVYEHSRLEWIEQADPEQLCPAQNYVLQADIENIEVLFSIFQREGIDIFALHGGLLFWLTDPESGAEEGPIPLIPPVVEESIEPDGRQVLLINDGMHRVYTAKKLGRKINIVLAHGVPPKYPYYAFALQNGWADVDELAELPDGYVKKAYRDKDNYKALFRDFNEVLPGVQKQRKRTNPGYLKG